MAVVHAQNVHNVLGQWVLNRALPVVCDLEKSHGAYLYDAKTDSEFLDFYCFVASRPLAFNHPKLKNKDFLSKLQRVALHKPANCDVFTPEYAEFTDLFCRTALGGKFRHVFFIEGGAPAAENAVKAAMDWKHRKNIAAGRGEKGSAILHFKQAFHGRTGYALSLTDSHDPRKSLYFPKFSWPRVTNPKMTFPFNDVAKADVEQREAVALNEIDAAFNRYQDEIAAIIIEPIQGEGGDNYFRSEFFAKLRRICDERECLLILDEVQTGFGTTGRWWDWQHHNVQPDLMTFGKKTQVCGFAATDRIDEVDSVFKVPSRISSTFEGNLTDMVRCQRIIEVIQEDNLVSNAETMGKYLLKVLYEISKQIPEMTQVRGRGLWAAFDLPTPEERDRVHKACFANQLLVIGGGVRSIRLRPALDVDADAIGRCGAQLEDAIKKAYDRT